ncbi:MAG TPA: HlyD family efflux transporter periplasmic adaptor subunit [Propionibacteriaceae bacterium]|nr:HlyD family efflux transporter periplasmic adaptor subunit [Propionibacteriaceae bacterium]
MTWTNRFRLTLSVLLSLVLIFLLVLLFNQRQHTIQSASATIIAPRVQVASNYGGIVLKQYVTVGQHVNVGDTLFDVSSVSLQQDVANHVKVTSSDAMAIDPGKGTLTYKATAAGTVTQVTAQEGSYLSATQPLATITSDTGRVVEAQFLLTPREYALVDKGAAVTLTLPDNSSVPGVVDSALVQTKDGQAVVTVRITSQSLNSRNLNLLATDGAPVSAVVRLRDEGILAGPTDAMRALLRKVGL